MNKDDFINFSRRKKITEDEFKNIVRFIRGTYPPRLSTELPFMSDKETFDVWYDLVKNECYLPMLLGVREICITNKYAPSLSEIMEATLKYSRKLDELDIVLDDVQDKASMCFPGIRMNQEDTDYYLNKFLVEKYEIHYGDIDLVISSVNSFGQFVEEWSCRDHKKIETFTELIDTW